MKGESALKKLILFISVFILAFCFISANAAPEYIGTWTCVFSVSADSTTFIMFQLRDDHTALYISQFYYQDHPGMTEKGIWPWEEINDQFFRILPDDGRILYFEMLDPDHLSAGQDLIYSRHIQEE